MCLHQTKSRYVAVGRGRQVRVCSFRAGMGRIHRRRDAQERVNISFFSLNFSSFLESLVYLPSFWRHTGKNSKMFIEVGRFGWFGW